MTNFDKIPLELKQLNQWVCIEDDNKYPMRSWEHVAASSTDPKSWATYEEAKYSVEHGFYPWAGFVFADTGIVGIDIDDGYDMFGEVSELAQDIVSKCESYTERSRSGRGFHILVKGDLPFKGRNNLAGVEIYKTARYFIMTGDTVGYDEVIENQEAIDYIIERYFPTARESKDTSFGGRIYKPVWKDVVNDGRIKVRPHYPSIVDGSRNISLTSLAGAMHSQGYSKASIYNELVYVNQLACKPHLSDSELRSICNSVTRYKR